MNVEADYHLDCILLIWMGDLIVKLIDPGKLDWNFSYVIFKQILVIDGWGISCKIALIWMSLDITDDPSALVQVIAWCRQATGHYLSLCYPDLCRYMVPLCQNELIGVIALVLQSILHSIIVFCNISWIRTE